MLYRLCKYCNIYCKLAIEVFRTSKMIVIHISVAVWILFTHITILCQPLQSIEHLRDEPTIGSGYMNTVHNNTVDCPVFCKCYHNKKGELIVACLNGVLVDVPKNIPRN